nr:cytochrome P450 6a2-like [Onthophagus taurus]
MISVEVLSSIFLLIITLILIIYLRMKLKFKYWEKKGVPQLENLPLPFGNAPNPFRIREPFYMKVKDYYFSFKNKNEKHGGLYMMSRPVYLAVDPEIVKNVMLRDFGHFHDRGTFYNEKVDPLSGHLFNLEGKQWRELRAKLTGTFTSGKMKMMFPTLLKCGYQMIEELEKMLEHPVDIKEILSCFSTDVIGSVAFGLECNSFKVPEAEFRKNGKKIFEPSLKRKVRVFLITSFPNLCKKLGLVFIPKEVTNFFLQVVKTMIDHRAANNIKRNDFMQILIDLNNLTVNQIAAQAFVFFIAGFETSATTINFCLFELAQNQEIQEKVRKEINKVFNEELKYELIGDLKYLNQVVEETLRKYPPVPHLSRKCTNEYEVPEMNVRLEKNSKVFISVLGIHKDPDFYPNPEVFDPERFNDENKAKRHPFTFIPFGEGPRNCIGSRFGMMQTKVGLILILKNFKVSLSSKTELPLEMEPSALLMTSKNKIWLDIEKIKT